MLKIQHTNKYGFDLSLGMEISSFKANISYCVNLLPGLSLPVPFDSANFCIKLSTVVFAMLLINSSCTFKKKKKAIKFKKYILL